MAKKAEYVLCADGPYYLTFNSLQDLEMHRTRRGEETQHPRSPFRGRLRG